MIFIKNSKRLHLKLRQERLKITNKRQFALGILRKMFASKIEQKSLKVSE